MSAPPTDPRALAQQRLARIALGMAIASGLFGLLLIPLGVWGMWVFVDMVSEGGFEQGISRAQVMALCVALLLMVGAGVWLCAGYIAVARKHPRDRSLWQASLAYNGVGVAAVVVGSVWAGATSVFQIVFAVWPVVMAVLSVQALRLTEEMPTGAMPTGEPVA